MKIVMMGLVTMVLALWTTVASAGSITIRDSVGFIPSSDVSKLQADQNNWPFETHILVENAPSFDTLETDAHNWIDSPNVIVIALDPARHKTVVRFGTATGVKQGDFDSISAAGNAHFRSHEIQQGFEAILFRAKASREAVTAMSTSSAPVVLQQGLSMGTWFVILLVIGGFAAMAVVLYRRSKKNEERFKAALDENRLETSELRSRNVEEASWAEAAKVLRTPTPKAPISSPRIDGYSSPIAQPRIPRAPLAPSVPYAPMVVSQPIYMPQAPVIVQQSSGSSDFLAGMLVEDALEGSRRGRDREVIREREVIIREEPVRTSRSSYDDGGSSSSYSGGSSSYDSGSSSSNNDSGGSSSSWDSGSSSDSGSSGGDDNGGSGSDW